MGKFERKAVRARQQAKAQDAGAYEDQPGREMLRVKVQHPAEGGDVPPTYHTVMDCNGQELLQAIAILLAQFAHNVADSHGGEAGTELCGLMGQLQLGAAEQLAKGGQG